MEEEGGRRVETGDPIYKSLHLPRRKEETGTKITVLNLQVKHKAFSYILVVRCAKKHLCFLYFFLENKSTLISTGRNILVMTNLYLFQTLFNVEKKKASRISRA